ncbi:uncharacterized protein LOC127813064 isoform X2 [Diospyros lotus]|uniref:uncharacterized protein LOC127813064 isoform X2 n=1 Tax=Diospyros lotus TaxID=55363 RepID=UPI00224E5295|nr:uncharacterized protein LOC127813064 isoform X2 [Diospyros lotus]
MYGHSNHSLIRYDTPDFLFPTLAAAAPMPNFESPPPLEARAGSNELEAMAAAPRKSEVGHGYGSCGSPSYSAPSTPGLMQRSVSTHSLRQKNNNTGTGFSRNMLPTLPAVFLGSGTSPVKRVCSTGDLEKLKMVQQYHQRSSESPLSNENNYTIIEGMNKACRYGPEEKKERIERYRSKRNRRNFNKKIKEDFGRQQATRQRSIREEQRDRGELSAEAAVLLEQPWWVWVCGGGKR